MNTQTSANPPLTDPRANVNAQARVGVGCIIKSGAYIGPGVCLEEGVYIGANVVFVDASSSTVVTATKVKRLAIIGANSTVYAGVVIAAKAEVRPGSVVTRSVPPNAIVEGNPASIVGYVDTVHEASRRLHTGPGSGQPTVETTLVKGVTVHQFSVVPDLRGNLTVGEFGRQIPFEPRRYFLVYGVPSREVRGEHAHRQCHQFLICLQGSCAVVADDGENKVEVLLDAPHRGMYLPPMIWGVQYQYSADAMLLVFASHHYDSADYIREYDEFLIAITRATA